MLTLISDGSNAKHFIWWWHYNVKSFNVLFYMQILHWDFSKQTSNSLLSGYSITHPPTPTLFPDYRIRYPTGVLTVQRQCIHLFVSRFRLDVINVLCMLWNSVTRVVRSICWPANFASGLLMYDFVSSSVCWFILIGYVERIVQNLSGVREYCKMGLPFLYKIISGCYNHIWEWTRHSLI